MSKEHAKTYNFRIVVDAGGWLEYLTPPSMQRTGGMPQVFKSCHNAPYTQIIWLR